MKRGDGQCSATKAFLKLTNGPSFLAWVVLAWAFCMLGVFLQWGLALASKKREATLTLANRSHLLNTLFPWLRHQCARSEIEFYLPTVQYFTELPFRLLNAEKVRYRGQKLLFGNTYRLFCVFWRENHPSADYDQYQVWINERTTRIDMVRDAVGFEKAMVAKQIQSLAMGTIYFEDYRLMQGVWMPFIHTIILPELTYFPLNKHYFHRLEIQAMVFDAVPRRK